MSAHQYWAIRMYPRAGAGSGLAVAEVEMRATVGGADQCSGGTPSGSFTVGTAANVFDNDGATYAYQGLVAPSLRLSYAFASPVTVAEMYLKVPGAGTHPGTTYGPSWCVVEWSDDGSQWYVGSGSFDASGLTNDQSMTAAVSDVEPGSFFRSLSFMKEAFPQTWPIGARLAAPILGSLKDVYFGGRGRISGTVKIKGTPNAPVKRKVRLIRERDGMCVAEQWSNPTTGAYQFDYFDETIKYTVLSYDYENNFRAIVADNLTPDIIP